MFTYPVHPYPMQAKAEPTSPAHKTFLVLGRPLEALKPRSGYELFRLWLMTVYKYRNTIIF
jgi:hypothetical protein